MSNTMFLVQGPGGRIQTVMAGSKLGAVKSFLKSNAVEEGSTIRVKERGVGDWEEYEAI